MIITFCGHSENYGEDNLEEKILKTIEGVANNEDVVFYLGNYGYFDHCAALAARKYKENHKNSVLIMVTPYIDQKYLKEINTPWLQYDEIVYPDLEKVPKRYAIIERNKYMVKMADIVIAYVRHRWGGAAMMLEEAKRRKKRYINLYQA